MGRATSQAADRIGGGKLYQQRARLAFPLLVRQAEARKQIFYSDLATELGMPNPRNLNFVLGCVGGTIVHLGKALKIDIPPIQCLVVNRTTGLPGEGIGGFMTRWGNFNSFDSQQKRQIVFAAHGEVFAFPRWHEVLSAVDLDPVSRVYNELIARAAALPVEHRGGESERHQMMKRYVAVCPNRIGLSDRTPEGELEVKLPSGDRLDVSFDNGKWWIAAEVKTRLSCESDLARGLFQCVKYRAIMEAMKVAGASSSNIRVILVLESALPPHLIPLRNALGIEVVENVAPHRMALYEGALQSVPQNETKNSSQGSRKIR